ncbi:MAG: tol-pal system protein YbgF [Alphaproteobacteria bacterium]|nr:tol-pal system protein YbgF [Alphaproteobacteria bacterium]
MQTMNRAIYKGETPPPSSYNAAAPNEAAEALVRMQQLEAQIQTLTGKIEEQGFEIMQLRNQIDRMTSDYDLRLKDLESGRGGSGGGMAQPYSGYSEPSTPSYQPPATSSDMPPQPAPAEGGYTFSTNNVVAADDYSAPAANPLGTITQNAQGQAVSDGDSVAAAYENAFSLLKAGNYDAAEREFDAFLKANPDHVLAGNAKYWLGETYYVRGDFEKAARVFAEAYQKYPDGSKAADNLLKLGLSLASTGNKTDACVAFRQLEKDYQSGAGPVLRRAQQEMSKLGC